MKSAHRHELETNALAHRLEDVIDRVRPHISTIVGVIAGLVILILAWSWFSKYSSGRNAEAWDAYNLAVGSMPPDLRTLHEVAGEHPNSEMQQLADLAWADGKTYEASMNFFYNRAAAKTALGEATSAYQAVLSQAGNERILNRAHLGMARVYEMQNELEKAREEYGKVTGGYATFAKEQVERLAKPESKETYDWLATAEPIRTQPPTGPGTPGQQPEFAPGDLSLPDATQGETGSDVPAGGAQSFDDVLNNLRLSLPSTEQQAAPDGLGLPVKSEDVPATEGGTPPATDTNPPAPASDGGAATPSSTPETPAPAAEETPAQ